jgi:hypothetical protein
MAGWHGTFINLDRSVDRRNSIVAQLAGNGLGDIYARFPAVDGSTAGGASPLKPAEVGCFLSHYRIVSQAKPEDGFLHIVEDDVVFSKYLRPALDQFIAQGALQRFDLIYLDIMMMVRDRASIEKLKVAYDACMGPEGTTFRLIDLANFRFLSTSSYLVNPRSLTRIRRGLEADMTDGVPSRQIDVVYLDLVRKAQVKAACFFPFMTSLSAPLSASSTVGTQFGTRIADMIRGSFFVEFDLAKARRTVPRFRVGPGPDSHSAYLDDVLRLVPE